MVYGDKVEDRRAVDGPRRSRRASASAVAGRRRRGRQIPRGRWGGGGTAIPIGAYVKRDGVLRFEPNIDLAAGGRDARSSASPAGGCPA